MPDFAPPIGGPEIVNFTSIVFASDSTSRRSRPLRIRVPPPAAPPRSELITVQPRAPVSASVHSKTISGVLCSNFSSKFATVFFAPWAAFLLMSSAFLWDLVAEVSDARHGTGTRAVGESRETEWRWIDDWGRAGHEIGAEPPGGRADAEAVPGKAGGDNEARHLIDAGDHRQGV